MRRFFGWRSGWAAGLLALASAAALPAFAQQDAAAPAAGGVPVFAPEPWAVALQPAGGPVKEAIHDFNNLVLYIIIAITAFVLVLLAWVVWRYRAAANPTPSRTSHNTIIEITWTVVPVLILVIIAIPSFRLIYYEDRPRDPQMTINVQGRQWYWHYEYPDQGNLAFDSRPIPSDELKPGQLRNLSVDEPLIIPVGADIRILTTGQDVIHSFFVPSLGVQKYSIPGRTLETWFRADQPGIFYGECNQICGTNHWFMPIEVHAVPKAEFEAWVAQAKKKYAGTDGAPAAAPAAVPAVQVAGR
ncbi:MAG TPA: cytochrome c oxidase subunit II [Crenalkalicoccus sp.]|nr:cytochrome c oxidase subunit II [Crenalkalicoccus sp.]